MRRQGDEKAYNVGWIIRLTKRVKVGAVLTHPEYEEVPVKVRYERVKRRKQEQAIVGNFRNQSDNNFIKVYGDIEVSKDDLFLFSLNQIPQKIGEAAKTNKNGIVWTDYGIIKSAELVPEKDHRNRRRLNYHSDTTWIIEIT